MDLKAKIRAHVDNHYKGSYRFLKSGSIGKIQSDAVAIIKQTVVDKRLHTPLSLAVFCYMNDIYTTPLCKICSAETRFNTTKKVFATYCSNACRFADMDAIQDLKRTTNLEKYGVTNVLNSVHVKIGTELKMLNKHGVTHYCKSQDYRDRLTSGDIIRKPNPTKISYTHRYRHYHENICKWDHIEPLFTFEQYEGAASFKLYDWRCKHCFCTFSQWLNNGDIPECPNCSQTGSRDERIIKEYLTSRNITFKYRDRTTLIPVPGNSITDAKTLEIDFLILSHKIGIEVNGLRYHHGLAKHKMYHQYKTDLGAKVGIKMIHIFGDQLINRSTRKIVFQD